MNDRGVPRAIPPPPEKRMKPELANGDGVSEGGRTGVTHGAPRRRVQLPAGGAHVRPGGSVGTRVRPNPQHG